MSTIVTITISPSKSGYSVKSDWGTFGIALPDPETLIGARWLSNLIKEAAKLKGFAASQFEEGIGINE